MAPILETNEADPQAVSRDALSFTDQERRGPRQLPQVVLPDEIEARSSRSPFAPPRALCSGEQNSSGSAVGPAMTTSIFHGPPPDVCGDRPALWAATLAATSEVSPV